MRKPLKKYCNLCGDPVIPEIRKYGQYPGWYYPKRCPECFKKRFSYKRHFPVGSHGNARPEGSKGITKKKNHTYIIIKQNGQWKYEHRVIMEQSLGRPLLKDETVHHINENTLDNRPENLQLFSCMGDHVKHHASIKPQKQCSIPSCTRPHKGHGFCTLHYQRFKIHGDPLYKKERKFFCTVKGCNRKHYGLGYCAMHYKRFKKHGDPLYKKV